MRPKLNSAVLWVFAATAVFENAASQTAAELSDTLPLDPQVTIGTLDSGLRYCIRANQRTENRAEFRLALNVGSVPEDDGPASEDLVKVKKSQRRFGSSIRATTFESHCIPSSGSNLASFGTANRATGHGIGRTLT